MTIILPLKRRAPTRLLGQSHLSLLLKVKTCPKSKQFLKEVIIQKLKATVILV